MLMFQKTSLKRRVGEYFFLNLKSQVLNILHYLVHASKIFMLQYTQEDTHTHTHTHVYIYIYTHTQIYMHDIYHLNILTKAVLNFCNHQLKICQKQDLV